MASETADLPVPEQPGILRRFSDPMVLGSKRRQSLSVQEALGIDPGTGKHIAQREDVAVQTLEQGTLIVATRAPISSKALRPTRITKARHQLQLPSFQSLGIANLLPTSILTPPDEPTSMRWTPIGMDHSQVPPTSFAAVPVSTPSSNTPQTSTPRSVMHTASNDTVTQGAGDSFVSSAIPSAQSHGSGSSDSSTATEVASNKPWLDGAITVILSHVPTGNNNTDVVTVLSHPQPCPLSQNILGAPSALNGIINAIQTLFMQSSVNRYIDVVHAVPVDFKLSQLPTSPMTTPNRPATEADMGDYFSTTETTVLTKSTATVSHAESRQTLMGNPANKAFPQPIVAPSSIFISVLERFIPPATIAEYNDLFKFDHPSALVDRMVELKPGSGNLVFVYPTQKGAITFREEYLGPILDPQLRTMIGIHNISPNMVAKIGCLEPIHAMHDFDPLQVKVTQLLASMNRKGGGNLHRFTIVSASLQSVHVAREAWVKWFTEQEVPRMRDIMSKHYARAPRSPQTEGVGDYTAAGLVREITDGIKGRAYEAGEAPREGIEVGVFVIKRVR